MGTLIGHVAPGFGFLLIGLWHLYNNIKLYSLRPKSYSSLPWFPFPFQKLRRLELLLVAAGSTASIAMELFIGPNRHQPLDPDLSIPSNHLHNFEHASISLTFLLYSFFAAALERSPASQPLTSLAAAAAFGQQLFLFHLHSTDHMGVEGQYHFLLQLVIAVLFLTALMGIGHPRSFAVGFVRSASIAMQGIWFVVMGYALWTPGLIPKGCFMNDEDGHTVVRCRSAESLHRAKSLVNIGFSWLLTAVVGSCLLLYLLLSRRYTKQAAYLSAMKAVRQDEESEDFDLESEQRSFVSLEKGMRDNIDLER